MVVFAWATSRYVWQKVRPSSASRWQVSCHLPSFVGLETLESRRDQLTERFFHRSVLPEMSCLLSDKRDPFVTDRLRHPRNFETLKSRTAKFQNSLIPYYLTHFLKAYNLFLVFFVFCLYSIDFICKWHCTLIQPLAAIWNKPVY